VTGTPSGDATGEVTSASVAAALAEAHRREWAYVLAATVRVAGDLDLAEECTQEAYVSALETWPRSGVPSNPGAWLTTTARNKVLDRLRRESALRRKLPLLVEPDPDGGDPAQEVAEAESARVTRTVPDDRLRLVFTCCHPALAPEAQVALTLRLVCGVATPDVARAFLVPEATMAARITRAKKKISTARIPYRVPAADELPGRVDAVLTTVHLLFSTGHTAPAGSDLVRPDLCARAVELARTLLQLLPRAAEVRGLLGLLLLTDARRGTRTDPDGRLVLLENQDRARWNPYAITEGLRQTAEALLSPDCGRFTLQAAISGVHAVARSSEQTDWQRIVVLYDRLLALWDSPVVALNRAVAVSFLHGPEQALALVDELAHDPRLAGYPYLPATRADLLRRLTRLDDAAAAYREALQHNGNDAEREFLRSRLAEVLAAR
jgi:RNA polymerase sigma-70 factor, ECF subfamily